MEKEVRILRAANGFICFPPVEHRHMDQSPLVFNTLSEVYLWLQGALDRDD